MHYYPHFEEQKDIEGLNPDSEGSGTVGAHSKVKPRLTQCSPP